MACGTGNIVEHDGVRPPTLTRRFPPSSVRWVWFAWPETTAITNSSFDLPAPLQEVSTQMAQTVVDEETGTEYPNANGVLVDFNGAKPGRYLVTNNIESADQVDSRSCNVVVDVI